MRLSIPVRGGGEKEIGENDCVVGFGNISIRSDSERRRCLVLSAIRGASDCFIGEWRMLSKSLEQ